MFVIITWIWIGLIPVHLALVAWRWTSTPVWFIAHAVVGALLLALGEMQARRQPDPDEWIKLIEGEDRTTVEEWIRTIREQAQK